MVSDKNLTDPDLSCAPDTLPTICTFDKCGERRRTRDGDGVLLCPVFQPGVFNALHLLCFDRSVRVDFWLG